MSLDSNYTEENAQQAIEFAEKQLKRALFGLLAFKDSYSGSNHRRKYELIMDTTGAAAGAMVAITELRDWVKPIP